LPRGHAGVTFTACLFPACPGRLGRAPNPSRCLILQNSTNAAETVSIRVVGKAGLSGGTVARVAVEPLAEGTRAVRLLSLTPFHARVVANRDCFVETPKLFRARIFGDGGRHNGSRPEERGRSRRDTGPKGHARREPFVQGQHDSTLLSYWGSACAWLALIAVTCGVAFRRRDAAEPATRARNGRPSGTGSLVRGRRPRSPPQPLPPVVGFWRSPGMGERYGDVRMVVLLPWGGGWPVGTPGHHGEHGAGGLRLRHLSGRPPCPGGPRQVGPRGREKRPRSRSTRPFPRG
jgi:hypothetical protein